MSNNRIPNHRIDSLVADLEEFTNYNASIVAYHESNSTPADPVGTRYVIRHWRTNILELDATSMEILDFAHGYISQTTSRLVGRIIRNLPRATVEQYLNRLNRINPTDAKRLARMAGI
jgi:hypothetical protein